MKKVLCSFAICLLLCGCWDQVKLKQLLFVDAIGIDYAGDGKKLQVGYVTSSLHEANQGGGRPTGQYLGSTGTSLYDAVANMNKAMPGVLSVLETRLYLIGSRFAKDQPLNYLGSVAQFSSNPLYASLAVYDGDLTELLSKTKIKNQTVSNFLVGLLDDEQTRGRIPTNRLLHYILGGSEYFNDFALNRFEPYEDGARLAGTALFRDGVYTGINLNNEETQLVHLMKDAEAKNQLLTGYPEGNQYSVLIQNAKRDYHVKSIGQGLEEIEVEIPLDVKLVEDGLELKNRPKPDLKRLKQSIETDLSQKTARVLATLQKANCDYLQLGEEVAAFHPKKYNAMNWREEYPKLQLRPNVKVTILNTGILE